jgi:hypothetical protein
MMVGHVESPYEPKTATTDELPDCWFQWILQIVSHLREEASVTSATPIFVPQFS